MEVICSIGKGSKVKKKQVEHEALFVIIANNIKTHKRQIIGVGASTKEPAFAYTIGNQEKGLPELLLIGNFHPNITHGILTTVSDSMIEQKASFKDGHLFNLGGTHSVKIIDAKDPKAKKDYTVQAGQFYANEDYLVQQVIIPDTNGNWPDDPGCNVKFKVPVLKSALLLP